MDNNTNSAAQTFQTQRIYVKDLSFDAPGGPNTFLNPWDPDLTVDFDVTTEAVSDDHHEVVLTITVTAKNAGTVAFMIEIFQAGIFHCSGYEETELHQILHTVCPNLLFPYASEAADNLALRGSFPALMLEPVNFAAIYAENKGD